MDNALVCTYPPSVELILKLSEEKFFLYLELRKQLEQKLKEVKQLEQQLNELING